MSDYLTDLYTGKSKYKNCQKLPPVGFKTRTSRSSSQCLTNSSFPVSHKVGNVVNFALGIEIKGIWSNSINFGTAIKIMYCNLFNLYEFC